MSETRSKSIILLDRLQQEFQLQDLQNIATKLGVHWGNILGETKDAKALSLIKYLEKRNRLPHLEQLLSQYRPVQSSSQNKNSIDVAGTLTVKQTVQQSGQDNQIKIDQGGLIETSHLIQTDKET